MIEFLAPIAQRVKALYDALTVSTRMANLDNLDAAVSAITPIRSIQYGTITLSGATSATATIASVTVGKTVLTLLGFKPNGVAVAAGFQAVAPAITLTNSTTVTATKDTGTGIVVVHFVATEYK